MQKVKTYQEQMLMIFSGGATTTAGTGTTTTGDGTTTTGCLALRIFNSLFLYFKDPAQPQPQRPHQLQRLRSQPQPQWLWRRPQRLALVPLPQVTILSDTKVA